jgi:hypothetical protein
LSIGQIAKNSNIDEEIFKFVLDKMRAETLVRSFDLVGKFDVGGMTCTHLLLKTPEGLPVKILSTKKSEFDEENLLSIEYTDVKKNSPELHSEHGSILKKLDVKLTSVDIFVHQDAIMDLVDKVKFKLWVRDSNSSSKFQFEFEISIRVQKGTGTSRAFGVTLVNFCLPNNRKF